MCFSFKDLNKHCRDIWNISYIAEISETFLCILFFLGTTTTSTSNQCLTTNDSPTLNAACVFPWRFQDDRLRQGCINDTDPDGKYWCSTKTDPQSLEHIGGEGNWGFCTNSCPPINQGTITTYKLQTFF